MKTSLLPGIPRLLQRARNLVTQHNGRHRRSALSALRPQSDPARNRNALLIALTNEADYPLST